jgi:hypothetical protein
VQVEVVAALLLLELGPLLAARKRGHIPPGDAARDKPE